MSNYLITISVDVFFAHYTAPLFVVLYPPHRDSSPQKLDSIITKRRKKIFNHVAVCASLMINIIKVIFGGERRSETREEKINKCTTARANVTSSNPLLRDRIPALPSFPYLGLSVGARGKAHLLIKTNKQPEQ